MIPDGFLQSGFNPMLFKKFWRLCDDLIPDEFFFKSGPIQSYLKSLGRLCDDVIPDKFLQSGLNPMLLAYY